MPKPYLVRLAKTSEALSESAENLSYDVRRQLTIVTDEPNGVPAIVHPDVPTLGTKKADREKGEDQKDRWR